MAAGRLGVAALAADTDTTVYTVPALTVATLNVLVVNRGTTPALVRVAISTVNPPTAQTYIEYDVEVPANGILERMAVVASAAELVVVRANTANCTVRVNGFEEAV